MIHREGWLMIYTDINGTRTLKESWCRFVQDWESGSVLMVIYQTDLSLTAGISSFIIDPNMYIQL